MRHETATFGQTQIQKFQLSFYFCLFLLFQQQKAPKLAETPIFSGLANLKKEKFQRFGWLKHRKLKNPIFAPFVWKKGYFWKIAR